MAIQVLTKDCAALGDADFAEMADLVAPTAGWEVGTISKQAEEWVLASLATDRDKLQGFMMMTLERIGGTPALVVGIASVTTDETTAGDSQGSDERGLSQGVDGLPGRRRHRCVAAGQLWAPRGFRGADRCRPWPETRVNGEERAWGETLSKRFGAVEFDDRTMLAEAMASTSSSIHESSKTCRAPAVLEDCDADSGQYVIAWGWAMAEFLETLG